MKKLISYTTLGLALIASLSSSYATTFKLALQPQVGSNEYNTALKLKEIVEKQTNGDLKIEIFPGGQLGDDITTLRPLSAGTLDMVFLEFARFGLFVPRAGVVQVPYLFKDWAEYKKVFNSDWGQNILKEIADKNNYLVFDSFYNGTRQTTSNRILRNLADFKGLKLRVPKSEFNLAFAKYTGAIPTPLAFSEVYLALQTNAVDGQENPLPTIKAKQFYQVQPYLALTNHILNDQLIVLNKNNFAKLPKDQQTILKNAIIKVGEEHTLKVQADEASLVDYFKSQGVTVTTPDIAEFKKAMQPYYAAYEKEKGFKVFDDIEKAKK